MAAGVAQSEQLLPIEPHGVHLLGVGHRPQLAVHGGECNMLAGVLEPRMQLLCGDEVVRTLQRLPNDVLLPCIALAHVPHLANP